MDTNALHELIDYYVQETQDHAAVLFSAAALGASLLALVFSLYIFREQRHQTVYAYLAGTWNGVLDLAHQNPAYFDAAVTQINSELMSHEDQYKYDIFCHKAWGHVDDIIKKGFHKTPFLKRLFPKLPSHNRDKFESIIQWVTSYHYEWLRTNPTFFKEKAFWEAVIQARDEPRLVFRYRDLPQKDKKLDWDAIAEDYHKYILGPFAPEMVKKENGSPRNKLLTYLEGIPAKDLEEMQVADFGCGPGNLIPHLANRVKKLTGIDKSGRALEIAQARANECGIEFDARPGDMLEIAGADHFDLIISCNSIVENSRCGNEAVLRAMRDRLKGDGRLVAILPSFDTILYLRDLWKEHYLDLTKDQAHVKRILKAFDLTKKLDTENFSYADDGRSSQCYHTPETIAEEFPRQGLRIIGKPKKVLYPWNLTKRFDYGNFHGRDEIWDWFVVAERCPVGSARTEPDTPPIASSDIGS